MKQDKERAHQACGPRHSLALVWPWGGACILECKSDADLYPVEPRVPDPVPSYQSRISEGLHPGGACVASQMEQLQSAEDTSSVQGVTVNNRRTHTAAGGWEPRLVGALVGHHTAYDSLSYALLKFTASVSFSPPTILWSQFSGKHTRVRLLEKLHPPRTLMAAAENVEWMILRGKSIKEYGIQNREGETEQGVFSGKDPGWGVGHWNLNNIIKLPPLWGRGMSCALYQ